MSEIKKGVPEDASSWDAKPGSVDQIRAEEIYQAMKGAREALPAHMRDHREVDIPAWE